MPASGSPEAPWYHGAPSYEAQMAFLCSKIAIRPPHTTSLATNMHRTVPDGTRRVHSARQASLKFSAQQQQHSRAPRGRHHICKAAATVTKGAPVKQAAGFTVQGTSRKRNEDRFALQVDSDQSPFLYAGVFDGHGGIATADWLEKNLISYINKFWGGGKAAESDITDAFLKADEKLLAPRGGFFGGMGERGIGGSKCGSTGAVALVFREGGKQKLLAANVGDARVLVARKGKALQLTIDHVPDSEAERKRIEGTNPNPKMQLVRYVGGTWRVGGLLALSRAFGDAYMKGSLQFEGVRAGGDGYSSGFGVVAEPDTALVDLTGDDSWLILASDGLFANQERGGGGGLENQEVVDMCLKSGGAGAEQLAKRLAFAAQEAGSTDDVTVVLLQLK